MENWIEVVTRTGKQLSIQTTFGFQALRKTTHLSCNIMASGVNGVACQVKQNLLRTGFPWIPLMDRDFFDNTQSNSVSMLVESPKIINQPSFLSYICDASIIFIYICICIHIWIPFNWGDEQFAMNSAAFSHQPHHQSHQPRCRAAEAPPGPAPHDGPWRHWRCGSCRSNDRLHSPGQRDPSKGRSKAATPKMWENGVCIMGISW